jgi:hypothetical protein
MIRRIATLPVATGEAREWLSATKFNKEPGKEEEVSMELDVRGILPPFELRRLRKSGGGA